MSARGDAKQRALDTYELLRRRIAAAAGADNPSPEVKCSARELEAIESMLAAPPTIRMPADPNYGCHRLLADERRENVEIEVVVYFARRCWVRIAGGDKLSSRIEVRPVAAQGAAQIIMAQMS